MKKEWEVEADGVKHEIKFESGIGRKLTIDGEVKKLKSLSLFDNKIDYEINFGSTVCHLVVIGVVADLAVNGTFLGCNKPYEEANSNIPSWVYVLVGISTGAACYLAGIFALIVGAIMSSLYIKFAREKEYGGVIASFVGCCIRCCILQLIVVTVVTLFFS